MQLVTAQFLLAKMAAVSFSIASPAPLEASFRALVRQSEAMSSFVMERDALCASDRVSLWKIICFNFALVNLRCSKVIKRVRVVIICVFPNSLIKAMHCAVAAGRACSKPRKA